MKATGIVRRIDDLGRVVIPKEIRRTLHIREGDPLEIFTENDMVCFKKYGYLSSIENIIKACYEELVFQNVRCAFYDMDSRMIGPKAFPDYIDDVIEHPESFKYQTISANGECLGYVAYMDGRHTNTINTIIRIIARSAE